MCRRRRRLVFLMAAEFDVIVIGGGVVGLALAAKLAKTKRTLLIEQHQELGSETSSRNSEVIHAGLYYPSGSLKERLCIKGRQLLYAYAEEKQIAHKKIGKLIVSQKTDCPKLEALQKKAKHLNIPIKPLSTKELQELEPKVKASSALFSTETGIIDSHGLMQALTYDCEQAGGLLVKRSCFESAIQTEQGFKVSIKTDDGEFVTTTESLINAAGLYATQVANSIHFKHANRQIPKTLFCAGRYFSYQGRSPFKHLIYPLPDENLAGLGIHATLDLAGQARFGPDAQYVGAHSPKELDYQFGDELKNKFFSSIKEYFPSIEAKRLASDYCGVRPKLSSQNQEPQDFCVQIYKTHTAKLVELFGIESPGLTACMALADYVDERID